VHPIFLISSLSHCLRIASFSDEVDVVRHFVVVVVVVFVVVVVVVIYYFFVAMIDIFMGSTA